MLNCYGMLELVEELARLMECVKLLRNTRGIVSLWPITFPINSIKVLTDDFVVSFSYCFKFQCSTSMAWLTVDSFLCKFFLICPRTSELRKFMSLVCCFIQWEILRHLVWWKAVKNCRKNQLKLFRVHIFILSRNLRPICDWWLLTETVHLNSESVISWLPHLKDGITWSWISWDSLVSAHECKNGSTVWRNWNAWVCFLLTWFDEFFKVS